MLQGGGAVLAPLSKVSESARIRQRLFPRLAGVSAFDYGRPPSVPSSGESPAYSCSPYGEPLLQL